MKWSCVGSMAATLYNLSHEYNPTKPNQSHKIIHLFYFYHFLISSSSLQPHTVISKMALQAPLTIPTTKSSLSKASLLPSDNARLPRPRPADSFALRSSFFSTPLNVLLPPPQPRSIPQAAPKILMRTASKQAYICRDCGYIYSDKTPFEKLPDKYFCPVCGAPKRRFRAYEPPVDKNANAKDVRKARKAELQREETIGKALPIAIVVGVLALVGLYFYVNTAF